MFDKEVDVWGTFENPYLHAGDIAKWLKTENTTSIVSKIDPDKVIKFNLGSLSREIRSIRRNCRNTIANGMDRERTAVVTRIA